MPQRYRWPTDPPGKAPSHTISWATHQANLNAQHQVQQQANQQNAVNQAKAQGPPKGLPPGAPGTPGAPAAGAGAAPTPSAAAAPITPDAQFLAEAAKRAFDRTTQLNALTQESTDDKTNTTTALNRLAENALTDRTKINEGANAQGLFYSNQRSKRLGEYETALTRARSDAQTAFDQREAARTAQRTSIEQGGPLDEAVAMALAAQRQVGRDTDAADLSALVPNVDTSPAVAMAAAGYDTIRTNRRDRKGRTGRYHVYSNGRRVWVPDR